MIVPGSTIEYEDFCGSSDDMTSEAEANESIGRPNLKPESYWSVVLAGGEGARLRPLVQRIHPDGRPKQYAVFTGSRSLLRHTLDRVALAVPEERTVVVVTRVHAPFFSLDLSRGKGPKVLVQPADRGTAAGVLLPVHWIASRDPLATIAVFPSDHFVGDDAAFMRHVDRLCEIVPRHPKRIVLVGAPPDGPDIGYGWIEPGPALEESTGESVRVVERFREKPSAEVARACMETGGLWNTFVMVAKASALIEAGRKALPELHERLARVASSFGTDSEASAIECAYNSVPASNFSEAILASSSSMLAVSTLPAVTWSDWGTPERVIATLRKERIVPPWLQRGPRRVSRDPQQAGHHAMFLAPNFGQQGGRDEQRIRASLSDSAGRVHHRPDHRGARQIPSSPD